jgi:pimeloyl-ACP methyl ester carboxylesterase
MLRSLVRELTASGAHVLTFDYSGHGASPGALTYDNASTDRLAGQVQTAMAEFQRLSGLDASQIVWLGHSLGARVALQSSVLGPLRPAKLILLGAQVNLGANAQSEFFTGTTDSDLPWVQSLGPDTPPVPIILLTGAWEDILTVDGAQLLMARFYGVQTESCGGTSPREWILFDALVHNYEVYSPRVISAALDSIFPEDSSHPPLFSTLRIILWLVMVAGLFLGLIGLVNTLPSVPSAPSVTVSHPKKLVWGKLWLWLIALPLSGLVMGVYVLIPLPSPTFNLIYGGFLGGYGLLMFLLYWFGRMPGVTGKLRQFNPQGASLPNGWRLAILFNIALFAAVTLLYRSGLGMAPPVGVRFVWVLIFLPLTTLGFLLGMLEGEALSVAAPGRPVYRVISTLISLFPFYLYMILLLSLGSTSGVLGSLTGLLVLAASLLQGEITRKLSGNPLFAAVLQALLIFWLILPSGALFTPFF